MMIKLRSSVSSPLTKRNAASASRTRQPTATDPDRHRPRWRRRWHSDAVASIIGTILMMLLTVSLFAGLIFFLQYIPTPERTPKVQFDLLANPNGTIILLHAGGSPLDDDVYTLILLARDAAGNEVMIGDPHRISTGTGAFREGERYYLDFGAVPDANLTYRLILLSEQGDVAAEYTVEYFTTALAPVLRSRYLVPDSPLRDQAFTVMLEVFDLENDLDVTTVQVNLTSIDNVTFPGPVVMNHLGGGEFNLSVPNGGPAGDYIIQFSATDFAGHVAGGQLAVHIGGGPPDLNATPELEFVSFTWRPTLPSNGDTGTFFVTVKNNGTGDASNAELILDLSDLQAPITKFISVSAGGTTSFRLNYGFSEGGSHQINVSVTATETGDVTYLQDPDQVTIPALAPWEYEILVLPRILLVNDTGYSGADDAVNNPVRFLQGVLETLNFPYTQVDVTGNGPSFATGNTPMNRFDIVIWTTGYKVNTLTSQDVSELIQYMDAGGDVWLISEAALDVGERLITDDIMAHFGVGSATEDVGPIDNLTLNPASPILPATIPGPYPVTAPNGGAEEAGDTITSFVGPNAVALFNDTTEVRGVTNSVSISGSESRRVFMSIEFSTIASTASQTELGFHILRWMGNFSAFPGEDIALIYQAISPTSVRFMENVTVDTQVINLGQNTQSFEVAFFVDDIRVADERVVDLLPGRIRILSFPWVASELGDHELVILADADNEIDETSETNNIISSAFGTTEVEVLYRILIVDDTGTAPDLPRDLVAAAFDTLGYSYENSTSNLTPGQLSDYTAVVWVSDDSPLSGTEESEIQAYLTVGGRLVMWAPSALAGSPPGFLTDLVSMPPLYDQPMPATLTGLTDDPVGHGLALPMDNTSVTEVFAEGTNGTGFLGSPGAWSGVHGSPDGTGTVVFFPWSPQNLTGIGPDLITAADDLELLLFLIMHHLDYRDPLPELRASAVDITIENPKPVLGRAYSFQVEISNLGQAASTALIRFLDGKVTPTGTIFEQVDSELVFLAADTSTTAEVVWNPLHTGNRRLAVAIDPLDQVSERLEFDNLPFIETEVFFFWDDMENGTGNFAHDATLVNINGGSPLDFYGNDRNVTTNVSSAWDPAYSNGCEEVDIIYYSYNVSYWCAENNGVGSAVSKGAVIDVVIGISGSKELRVGIPKPIDAAIAAAQQLVTDLGAGSRVAICGYQGQNARCADGASRVPWTDTATNLQTILDSIALQDTPQAISALWDITGMATAYATDPATDIGNRRVVIILGDGADFKGDEAPDKVERGSNVYAPWHSWNSSVTYDGTGGTYDGHYGRYMGNATLEGSWSSADTGQVERTRLGLLDIPIAVYTIGYGLEHDNHSAEASVRFPDGWMGEYAEQTTDPPLPVAGGSPDATSGGVWSDPAYAESGTSEFNFWRIANTSGGGEYFWASSPDALTAAFNSITAAITQPSFTANFTALPPVPVMGLFGGGYGGADGLGSGSKVGSGAATFGAPAPPAPQAPPAVSLPYAITNTSATADNPVEGVVVGTFADTFPLPDGVTENITEVPGAGGPFYTANPGLDNLGSSDCELWTIVDNGLAGNGGNAECKNKAAEGDPTPHLKFKYKKNKPAGGAYAEIPFTVTAAPVVSATLDFDDLVKKLAGSAAVYVWIESASGGDPCTGGALGCGGTWEYRRILSSTSAIYVARGPIDVTAALTVPGTYYLKIGLYSANINNDNEVWIDNINLTWTEPAAPSLEHTWTMGALAAGAVSHTVYVDAGISASFDDDFDFGWSSNPAGPFTTLFTVNAQAITSYSDAVTIPAATTGVVYINVVDTGAADTSLDTLLVDMIRIESNLSGAGGVDPEVSALRVQGFADATPGSLHVTNHTPVLAWTYSDGDGNAQVTYNVSVWQGPVGTGTLLWYKNASSANTSVVYGEVGGIPASPPALVDGADYNLSVVAEDSSGAWSDGLDPLVPAVPVTLLYESFNNTIKDYDFADWVADPSSSELKVEDGAGKCNSDAGIERCVKFKKFAPPTATLTLSFSLDASNLTDLGVEVWSWSKRAEVDDFVHIQIDDGSGWTTVVSAPGDDAQTWTAFQAAMSAYDGTIFQVRILWDFTSDGTDDEYRVDTLIINGTIPAYIPGGPTVMAFHLNTPPVDPASAVLPLDDGLAASGSTTITWSPGTDNESDALTYYYWVDLNASLTGPFVANGTSLTVTSASFTTVANTTYWWRVAAWDGWEWSNLTQPLNASAFNFTTIFYAGPCTPGSPSPIDLALGVSRLSTLAWSCAPGLAGLYAVWLDLGTGIPTTPVAVNLNDPAFDPGLLVPDQTYSWRVENCDAIGNCTLSPVWQFRTAPEPVGGPATGANYNKTMTTPSFGLEDASAASLRFWHRYNMLPTVNGAFLQVGYRQDTSVNYTWVYMIPDQAYSGNLWDQVLVEDSEGTRIEFVWNGRSGAGSGAWEDVSVSLLPYVPAGQNTTTGHVYRSDVRVRFNYTMFSAGTGEGWWVDDVTVKVTRDETVAVGTRHTDQWEMTTVVDRAGDVTNQAWWNHDPPGDRLKAGVDSSLVTVPIDLTRAANATLSAYVRFNLNSAAATPPDGFRVEVSTDQGSTWQALNLGVRAASGISGVNTTLPDNPTGVDAGNGWVPLSTLSRLNVDLNGFLGSQIIVRFRIVTNSDAAYAHDDGGSYFGFYLDDLIVRGETLGG